MRFIRSFACFSLGLFLSSPAPALPGELVTAAIATVAALPQDANARVKAFDYLLANASILSNRALLRDLYVRAFGEPSAVQPALRDREAETLHRMFLALGRHQVESVSPWLLTPQYASYLAEILVLPHLPPLAGQKLMQERWLWAVDPTPESDEEAFDRPGERCVRAEVFALIVPRLPLGALSQLLDVSPFGGCRMAEGPALFAFGARDNRTLTAIRAARASLRMRNTGDLRPAILQWVGRIEEGLAASGVQSTGCVDLLDPALPVDDALRQ